MLERFEQRLQRERPIWRRCPLGRSAKRNPRTAVFEEERSSREGPFEFDDCRIGARQGQIELRQICGRSHFDSRRGQDSIERVPIWWELDPDDEFFAGEGGEEGSRSEGFGGGEREQDVECGACAAITLWPYAATEQLQETLTEEETCRGEERSVSEKEVAKEEEAAEEEKGDNEPNG